MKQFIIGIFLSTFAWSGTSLATDLNDLTGAWQISFEKNGVKHPIRGKVDFNYFQNTLEYPYGEQPKKFKVKFDKI